MTEDGGFAHKLFLCAEHRRGEELTHWHSGHEPCAVCGATATTPHQVSIQFCDAKPRSVFVLEAIDKDGPDGDVWFATYERYEDREGTVSAALSPGDLRVPPDQPQYRFRIGEYQFVRAIVPTRRVPRGNGEKSS